MSSSSVESNTPSPEEVVPLKQKIAWGAGGAADYLIPNVMSSLAMPIFNVALGLNAVLVGLALSIPRLLDAITDPLVGNLSDNTRSRLGRRRPWILAGTLISVAVTALAWWPSADWSQGALFAWLLVMAILLLPVGYTLFSIPYNSFGLEMSQDYNERTRVLTWRFYFAQAFGLAAPWLYWLAVRPVFGGNEVIGVRWVAAGMALLILVSGLSVFFGTRERAATQQTKGLPFWNAFKVTWKNAPFRWLVASNLLLKLGLYVAFSFSFYINLFYVAGGDKSMAGALQGWVGTMLTVLGIPAMPIATWLSSRFGKRNATALALVVAALAHFSMWWTIRPDLPYLQLVSFFFAGIALNICWVLLGSMVGDICDEDQLTTGRRREGMYWSAFLFSDKVAMSIMTLGTGILLKLSGYVEGQTPGEDTLFSLRLLFVLLQGGGLLLGAFCLLGFAITPQRAAETQRRLAEMRSGSTPGGSL